MNPRYVIAFNRDRDAYQVPWALMERAQLECLVTDFYLPDFMSRCGLVQRIALGNRTCPGIPSMRVRCSARAVWLQIAALRRARTSHERNRVFGEIDASLSRQAGRLAMRTGASLFLYSGYAREAFSMAEGSGMKRLLFVYHPEGVVAQQIFAKDFAQHPEVAHSHRAHLESARPEQAEQLRIEARMADAIVCASTVTAEAVRSLLGGSDKLVCVVPYGCSPSSIDIPSGDARRADGKPRVLFVGQGNQRKGLHHLLKVWSRGLYLGAELTLVLNNTDSGISELLLGCPCAPRVLEGLTKQELEREYHRADIFVLPSLLEGFGLVYLEALSAGCHVIGTRNTGLPDLQPPQIAATVIAAGDLDELHSALESRIHDAACGNLDRRAIRAFAGTRSWARFRDGIRSFLREAELHPCSSGLRKEALAQDDFKVPHFPIHTN